MFSHFCRMFVGLVLFGSFQIAAAQSVPPLEAVCSGEQSALTPPSWTQVTITSDCVEVGNPRTTGGAVADQLATPTEGSTVVFSAGVSGIGETIGSTISGLTATTSYLVLVDAGYVTFTPAASEGANNTNPSLSITTTANEIFSITSPGDSMQEICHQFVAASETQAIVLGVGTTAPAGDLWALYYDNIRVVEGESCTATSNTCVGEGAPYATVEAWDAATLPAADGLGTPAPDCDGDGSDACEEGADPDTCDENDGNKCVGELPAPFQTSEAWVLAGEHAYPDCDGDGTPSCPPADTPCDDDDGTACVGPVPAPFQTTEAWIAAGMNAYPDCDGDGTPSCPPADTPCDDDDGNACVGPEAPAPFQTIAAWQAAGSHPAPDCDGDGDDNCKLSGAIEPCDPNDGDPCVTFADPDGVLTCNEDPLPELSSKDQSLSAMRAFGSIMRHVEYRLETSGQEHDGYLMQYTFENEDRGLGQGGRWTSFSLSSTELDGQLSGDGLYVNALAGWDMSEGENSLWGYILGAEYGDWSYVGEGDVQKLGVSAGLYGGRLLGERLQVTGYLTYTHFLNELENTMGQTANMQSDRLIGAIAINGKIGTSGGLTVKPFLDAQYAIERHNDYTYSNGGARFQGGTADIGEIGLGAEVNLPFNERWGSAFVRIEANKTFGDDAVTLSNGTVLAPNDDVTGSLGLGWVTNTSYDSIGRLELSVNDIGNDTREEVRFDGHWERNF